MSDIRIIVPTEAPNWLQPVILDTERGIRSKEPAIEPGTTSQFWRGDKTWQAVDSTTMTFTPVGGIASVTVQDAIAELDTEKLPAASVSAFGLTLIDDANASVARTTLGLGALATAGSINNGHWSGTALAVGNGGTGSTSAANARTALGVPAAANGTHTGTTTMVNATLSGVLDAALVRGDSFRLDATPSAIGATTATHKVEMTFNGVNYWVLLGS